MNYIRDLYSGRIGRLQYFIGALINYLFFAGMTMFDPYLPSGNLYEIVKIVILLLGFVFMFSILVRRLHDFNYSGWWSLIIILPIANAVAGLYLFLKSGDKTPNRFGNLPPASIDKKLTFLFLPP